MDIIKQLEPKDRAECWQLFTKLSRVFIVLKAPETDSVAELKSVTEKMNDIFIKNNFTSYFDITLDDDLFLERLLTEMNNIKNGKKFDD